MQVDACVRHHYRFYLRTFHISSSVLVIRKNRQFNITTYTLYCSFSLAVHLLFSYLFSPCKMAFALSNRAYDVDMLCGAETLHTTYRTRAKNADKVHALCWIGSWHKVSLSIHPGLHQLITIEVNLPYCQTLYGINIWRHHDLFSLRQCSVALLAK
jgi:hypothetical protein